ncbi:MAG: hypothetical protein A3F18_04955 [Legionellales bacterium RIFCSPHIGHO2_12_FULL_37_14]|nr:MAG: hypothetical protein A3F18_04955 [Legionellales bacterium RIFCSPHIGHO2_12_FULL_37_14]
MDIIFKGRHTGDELVQGVQGIVHLFKERYKVPEFREIHLVVTLVDGLGQDVELVDNQSTNVYRTFEVYRKETELRGQDSPATKPNLRLVVDNTRKRD